MGFAMNPTEVMASVFAVLVTYFGTSAIIKHPEKVFNGLYKISGLGVVAVAGCIIYDVTIDLSGPINYAATLATSFSKGNTLIALVGIGLSVAIALFTGMWNNGS